MASENYTKLPEQVAERIKKNIEAGVWQGAMPGRDHLAGELGVSGKTVEAALRQLQAEGTVVSQGAGRRRRIVSRVKVKPSKMRVALLGYDPLALTEGYLFELQHSLEIAGYAAFFTSKSQTELGHDVKRITRLVTGTRADAWIVIGGSRLLLEWFALQAVPVFALFGRRRGIPIAGAGPDKLPCTAHLMQRLFMLGHQRIVLLTQRSRRLPEPGAAEQCFLNSLAAHGITPGDYNLPDWEETAEGFHARMQSLFKITPPTAIIADEASLFFAAQQFCLSKGIRVPKDLSLISTDDDPMFSWLTPGVSHIRWDRQSIIRSVKRWMANVSRGKEDRRQTFSKAEFVEMGTTGPARQ